MIKIVALAIALAGLLGCTSVHGGRVGSSGVLLAPAACRTPAPGTGIVTFSRTFQTKVTGAWVEVLAGVGPLLLDPSRDMAAVRVIVLDGTLRIGGIVVSQEHGLTVLQASSRDPAAVSSQAVDGLVARAIAADALGMEMPDPSGERVPGWSLSLAPAPGTSWADVAGAADLVLALDTNG